MNKKEYKENTKQKETPCVDSYDYLANAASSGDCTGLIPSAPVSEAELESYRELYAFEPPKVPKSSHKSNEL